MRIQPSAVSFFPGLSSTGLMMRDLGGGIFLETLSLTEAVSFEGFAAFLSLVITFLTFFLGII